MDAKFMRSIDRNFHWNEGMEAKSTCFCKNSKLCYDKSETTLKAKANSMVAYPLYIVLLNFITKFRGFLIDHGPRLYVCCLSQHWTGSVSKMR